MPFDVSLLQPWHAYLFLTIFAVTFFLVKVEISGGKRMIPRVGLLLVGIISLASFFIIEDMLLRLSFLAAAIIVALVGRADEVRPLSADAQFAWQLGIVALLVFAGWTIPFVSNPWGEGIISLGWWQIGNFLVPGSILAAVWLLFFMNAINWIDGLDG
jgi:UDP-N-acetylmuramyl pentapeptide phosphotransferase/UDP-N-acetylglucosamine-1-phosphate transferase